MMVALSVCCCLATTQAHVTIVREGGPCRKRLRANDAQTPMNEFLINRPKRHCAAVTSNSLDAPER